MKRLFVAGVFAAGLLATPLLGGGVAHAAADNYCGTGNGSGGYASNPEGSGVGCLAAIAAGAQCGSGAGSGAFGYFGPGNDMAGGADGYQTGLNNSALCGNRP